MLQLHCNGCMIKPSCMLILSLDNTRYCHISTHNYWIISHCVVNFHYRILAIKKETWRTKKLNVTLRTRQQGGSGRFRDYTIDNRHVHYVGDFSRLDLLEGCSRVEFTFVGYVVSRDCFTSSRSSATPPENYDRLWATILMRYRFWSVYAWEKRTGRARCNETLSVICVEKKTVIKVFPQLLSMCVCSASLLARPDAFIQ